MKKATILCIAILSLTLISVSVKAQAPKPVATDTTAVQQLTDTTAAFTLRQLNEYLEEVGTYLGDKLTKAQWDIVMNANKAVLQRKVQDVIKADEEKRKKKQTH